MDFIKKIVTKLVIRKNVPQSNILGRWKIEYCNTKINRKIDLSNEDHCGPCGQYTNKLNK